MVRLLLSGFGFMGSVHARVVRGLDGVDLVGVVDPRGESIRDALKDCGWGDLPVHTDLSAALQGCDCDAVDLCVPTDLHRTQAEVAFARGKHVFCEKPLALNLADGEAIVAAAERAGVYLMVGQCIRFWSEYRELERVVRSGELGRLLSLEMARRAGRPGYTVGDWVANPSRCLGAALDFHIHDADFIHHLLGLPQAVTSSGTLYPSGWDHISTIYHFDQISVSAVGGWDYPATRAFRMEFHAVFSLGTLDFDSASTPSLLRCRTGGEPEASVLPSSGVSSPEGLEAYAAELACFAGCIERGQPPETATGAQAAQSLRLVLAEIESARTRKTVTL